MTDPDRRALPHLQVQANPQGAATAAAALIAEWLREDDRSPAVHVALAGGTTPAAAYRELADLVDDWQRIHLWFGDERMVPTGSPDANATMVRQTLLAHADVPAKNVHLVQTDRAPTDAAARYAAEMTRAVPTASDGTPVLDIVILGLGEDGHVASLFPDRPTLTSTATCLAVTDAPKPPPQRITLGLGVLNRARRRLVLTTGTAKASALAAALGAPDPHVPASLLQREDTWVITDAAAAAALGQD